MAIQFDSKALDAFRGAQFAKGRSIANFSKNDGITSSGTYKGTLGAMFRGKAAESSNNVARTELLKALAKSFGIYREIDNGFGRVTFTEEFMDKLSDLLGSAFKREDFKIDPDTGRVTSGKPLTARRIKAIVAQADRHLGKGFNVNEYIFRMEEIKEDAKINGLDDAAVQNAMMNNSKLRTFYKADKCLQFLKNDLFMPKQVRNPKTGAVKTVYGPDESETDNSIIRNNPKYQDLKRRGKSTKGVPPFQFRDPATGKYQPLTDLAEFNRTVLSPKLGDSLVHTERAEFDITTDDDIEPVKKYIHDTLRFFATKFVDVYLDDKAHNRLREFNEQYLTEPGVCLEDKGKSLMKYESRHAGNAGGAQMSKAEIAELERIADEPVGPKGKAQGAETLIYKEINFLQEGDNAAKYQESEDWKDFAGPIKAKLVGKRAQIVEPVKKPNSNAYEFKPVLEDGVPVVRPLTEKDINTIGPACLVNVTEV